MLCHDYMAVLCITYVDGTLHLHWQHCNFASILNSLYKLNPPDYPLRLFSLALYFTHYFLHLFALSFYSKMWKEKDLHRFFFILKLCSQKLSSDTLFYSMTIHFLICKVPRCIKFPILKLFSSHLNSALLSFVLIFMNLFLFTGLIF